MAPSTAQPIGLEDKAGRAVDMAVLAPFSAAVRATGLVSILAPPLSNPPPPLSPALSKPPPLTARCLAAAFLPRPLRPSLAVSPVLPAPHLIPLPKRPAPLTTPLPASLAPPFIIVPAFKAAAPPNKNLVVLLKPVPPSVGIGFPFSSSSCGNGLPFSSN